MAEKIFYKQLPKIELHAHLNGSLSPTILEKLGCPHEDINRYQKLTQELISNEKKLQECFSLFKIAHNATKDVGAIYKVTKYVIEEFYNDNVVYLELRTTPREEINMTKGQYIEAVIKGIQDSSKGILTKLLLSIDRGHDLITSQNTLEIIIDMRKKYPDIIKGVDFCGNPTAGFFSSDLFERARNNGLFVTLHCAEIRNPNEIEDILNFEPNRIGHGTFIHPKYGGSYKCWELYQEKKIPLECCLTSNVLCGTVSSYDKHHVQEWIKNSLPYSLCTDDKGVFETSLSFELELIAQHFQLTYDDIWKVMVNSVDFSFASYSEKVTLKEILEDWKLKNQF